jgi:hypothetical protein
MLIYVESGTFTYELLSIPFGARQPVTSFPEAILDPCSFLLCDTANLLCRIYLWLLVDTHVAEAECVIYLQCGGQRWRNRF